MLLKELGQEQIMAALKAGSRDEIKAHLQEAGIELPAKAPWDLPEEIAKTGMKLWQAVMVKPVETCADDEHDFQPAGTCEMERNAATMPGSTFRRAFRCTKCGTVKWDSDVKPEPVAEVAAAVADDPTAERAARRAARKAAREAAN